MPERVLLVNKACLGGSCGLGGDRRHSCCSAGVRANQLPPHFAFVLRLQIYLPCGRLQIANVVRIGVWAADPLAACELVRTCVLHPGTAQRAGSDLFEVLQAGPAVCLRLIAVVELRSHNNTPSSIHSATSRHLDLFASLELADQRRIQCGSLADPTRPHDLERQTTLARAKKRPQ